MWRNLSNAVLKIQNLKCLQRLRSKFKFQFKRPLKIHSVQINFFDRGARCENYTSTSYEVLRIGLLCVLYVYGRRFLASSLLLLLLPEASRWGV